MMGAERRSMVMTDEERKTPLTTSLATPLSPSLLPKSDPVHKVTIIPRGRRAGVTMYAAGARPLRLRP